jgi:hypothetical protein
MHMISAPPLPELILENLACDMAQAAMPISGPAGKKTTQRWRARGVGARRYRIAGLVGFRPADIDAYITVWMRQSASDPGPSD